jgi:hypothetical protein
MRGDAVTKPADHQDFLVQASWQGLPAEGAGGLLRGVLEGGGGSACVGQGSEGRL